MEYHMGPASSDEFEHSGRILREPAPRHIDLLSRLMILFGGTVQQMGWVFGGFGMIFFWVFVLNSEARFLLAFDGKWLDANGILTEVYATNSEVNDRPVYAYRFTYNVDGHIMEGESFGTFREQYEANLPVPVQYKSRNPQRARIEGMSSSMLPVWTIFVCIFPLIGGMMIFSGLYQNIRALRLLVHGQFTKGTLKNKLATDISINNQEVFKYEFEFDVDGKKEIARCKTHQGWKVEDEEQEIILYLPEQPQRNIIYDAIPIMPEINPRGELEPIPMHHSISLIIPVLAIVINAIFAYVFTQFNMMY